MIELDDGTFILEEGDEPEVLMGLNASFRCSCCKPSRQIYYQAFGKLTRYFHERDNSRAKRRGMHIGYEGNSGSKTRDYRR